jgi:hypothetical protein
MLECSPDLPGCLSSFSCARVDPSVTVHTSGLPTERVLGTRSGRLPGDQHALPGLILGFALVQRSVLPGAMVPICGVPHSASPHSFPHLPPRAGPHGAEHCMRCLQLPVCVRLGPCCVMMRPMPLPVSANTPWPGDRARMCQNNCESARPQLSNPASGPEDDECFGPSEGSEAEQCTRAPKGAC